MDQLAPGSTFAGYIIDARLGSGGMSTVYRATEPSLGRNVALKVMAAELSSDESFRTRFIYEARQAAAIDHPNVVPIYGSGEAEGRLYIAMRYVAGSDLSQIVRDHGALAPTRVADLLTQAAAALDAVHRAGMVHRDVKPHNFLVTPPDGSDAREHVYLADFGLTRSDARSQITKAGEFLGTLAYAPPEQLKNEEITPASDVYALGCVLYECLVGTRPFARDNDAAVVYAHLGEPPPKPSEVVSGLPLAVDDVVAAAMAKDPADRPASAGEVARGLRRALGLDTAELPIAAAGAVEAGLVAPAGEVDDAPTVTRARDHEQARAAIDAPTLPPSPGRDPAIPPVIPVPSPGAALAAEEAGAAPAGAAGSPADDGGASPVVVAPESAGKASSERSQAKRTPLLVGLGVLVVVVLVAGFVLVKPRGDESAGGTALPGVVSGTTIDVGGIGEGVQSAPVTIDPGVEVVHALDYADRAGDKVTSVVRFTNSTDTPVAVDHIEVVPKELAPTVDAIRFATADVTVLEADPVVQWLTTIAPRTSAQLVYEVGVEAGPAESGRLEAYASARDKAEAAWLAAHPERPALTAAEAKPSTDGGEIAGGNTTTTGSNGTTGNGGVTTTRGNGGNGGDPGGGGGESTTTKPTNPAVVAPGPPRSVKVFAESVQGTGDGNADSTVTLSWSAPVSGGAPLGYQVKSTAYKQNFDGSSCSGTPTVIGTPVVYDEQQATYRAASTNFACSWVEWQVLAFNLGGGSSWVTARGVVPDVRDKEYSWHWVRAVGGQATYGGAGSCGVAQYRGCETNPVKGTEIDPKQVVYVKQVD